MERRPSYRACGEAVGSCRQLQLPLMPRVSEFYGIAIYLYYADPNSPHFHAVYGGQQAEVDIRTGRSSSARSRSARSGWYRSGRRRTAPSCWKTGSVPAPGRR